MGVLVIGVGPFVTDPRLFCLYRCEGFLRPLPICDNELPSKELTDDTLI